MTGTMIFFTGVAVGILVMICLHGVRVQLEGGTRLDRMERHSIRRNKP